MYVYYVRYFKLLKRINVNKIKWVKMNGTIKELGNRKIQVEIMRNDIYDGIKSKLEIINEIRICIKSIKINE